MGQQLLRMGRPSPSPGPLDVALVRIWSGVPMSRSSSRAPLSCWPLEMRAETAAAFCDEPSVDAFLSKVERGIYSQPLRQKGCLPKWHRLRLIRDIARRHSLCFEASDPAEDIAELI
jgi:hypothetical protein